MPSPEGERLRQLSEQELALQTQARIKPLAYRSGFIFVTDPNGLAIPSHLSIERLTLYKQPENDVVVSSVYNQPVGPKLFSGTITFTDVISDPFEGDKFIRNGPRNSYFFVTDGKQKTYFVPPREIDFERDYDIHYPDRPDTDLVMVATDEPRPLVIGPAESIGDDPPQSAAGFLDDKSINAQLNAAMRRHDEELLLDGPMRSRTAQEVESSRVRLIELNELLDRIVPERDIIVPQKF